MLERLDPLVLKWVWGTTSKYWSEDLRLQVRLYNFSRSNVYEGAVPFKALKVRTWILKWILKWTGSQWSDAKTGEMCALLLPWVKSLKKNWFAFFLSLLIYSILQNQHQTDHSTGFKIRQEIQNNIQAHTKGSFCFIFQLRCGAKELCHLSFIFLWFEKISFREQSGINSLRQIFLLLIAGNKTESQQERKGFIISLDSLKICLQLSPQGYVTEGKTLLLLFTHK